MAGQIAKLFVRGSLCNVTAKLLDESQRQRVAEVVNLVRTDPMLQAARQAFINALGNTIGNEYKDPSFAEQEANIAVWRASVSSLYHKPMPEVISNPKQRKKYFQEWIFNALKQILNENKVARTRINQTITGINTDLATKLVSNFLTDNHIPILSVDHKSDKCIVVKAELLRLPASMLPNLWKIDHTLRRHRVKLSYNGENCSNIRIATDKPELIAIQIPKTINIKMVSFESHDTEDGESLRYTFEYQLAQNSLVADKVEFADVVQFIRGRLPEDAQTALDIIVSPPDAYIQQHGDDTRQCTIAKFLNKTPKEMANIFSLIRMHCLSAGVGL
jgi:hypothetical protein